MSELGLSLAFGAEFELFHNGVSGSRCSGTQLIYHFPVADGAAAPRTAGDFIFEKHRLAVQFIRFEEALHLQGLFRADFGALAACHADTVLEEQLEGVGLLV